MFRNLRINIFIYYFVTVSSFLTVLYYIITVGKIENIFLIVVVMLCFIVLSAVMISKLAVDPLEEHIKNLRNLSKETLHELNLPITTITTNLQMLEKNVTNEKELKRIQRIKKASDMLQERYNELDYMIKTQTSQDVKESFNLDELVDDRVEFLKHIYPDVKFTINSEKTTIFNDRIGLSKVIDNIIDNGVKYSTNKKIIDIELKNYELRIVDYGKGMDEVEILHIFDRYYQNNSNMKGFGIGLNMVKRFCDTNNVELSFKSSPNNGTEVKLKFKEI